MKKEIAKHIYHRYVSQLSRKGRQAENTRHRRTWSLNPVTRMAGSTRIYNRARAKIQSRREAVWTD